MAQRCLNCGGVVHRLDNRQYCDSCLEARGDADDSKRMIRQRSAVEGQTGMPDPVVIGEVIRSPVRQNDDSDAQVPHVLLLDLDDVDRATVEEEISELDGVSALFKSSNGNYHVHNLNVGPLGGQVLRSLGTVADDCHAGASWRAGSMSLRISEARLASSGTVVKSPPSLESVSWSTPSVRQSRPHWEVLRSQIHEGGPEMERSCDVIESLIEDTVGWEEGVSPIETVELAGTASNADRSTLDDGFGRRYHDSK